MFKNKWAVLRGSILFSFFASTVASAFNIEQADELYRQKNYKQAHQLYLNSAKLGSPKAQYQLASMNVQGLGTDKNQYQALIWYALAAEHQYDNAALILEKALVKLPPTTRQDLQADIVALKSQLGVKAINKQYFPTLNEALFIDKKPSKNNSKKDNNKISRKRLPRLAYSGDDQRHSSGIISSFSSINNSQHAMVEYDVAKDGSVRDPMVKFRVGALSEYLQICLN